jgi:hypothetical protein
MTGPALYLCSPVKSSVPKQQQHFLILILSLHKLLILFGKFPCPVLVHSNCFLGFWIMGMRELYTGAGDADGG